MLRTSQFRWMRSLPLPPLSYTLSRNIELPWLTPILYGAGLVGLVSLIVLNVALTTYDDILTPTDNFKATQTLWYHRFTGPPEPGTQCSSYNLTVGQQLTTTNNLLTYTLLKIEGNRTALPYKGVPLDNCDVISTVVDVDMTATSVTNIAYIACNSSGLQITAKTEYISSEVPSLEDTGDLSPGQDFFDPPPTARSLVAAAFTELCSNLKDLLRSMPLGPQSSPWRISVQGIPNCSRHPRYSKQRSDYCADNNTVPVTWLYGGPLKAYVGSANGTEFPLQLPGGVNTGPGWVNLGWLYDTTHANISATYLPAITNIMQVLISTVRLDLGLILPNNPFLNMSVMNATLHNSFPKVVGKLGKEEWKQTAHDLGDPNNIDNFNMATYLNGNSTYLNGEYQCRFWYPIAWPQATVNVMVATLSLFTTGWGLAMLVIAFFMNKSPQDNYCVGHAAVQNPRLFDADYLPTLEKMGTSKRMDSASPFSSFQNE